ncbi:hypothetical protein PSQ39_17350 [Curvibacter sp. HBC28]|uniref:DUF1287 domain-containing protein n=1 Tax=Curvibacter microcysteis TaxID=3026419 RepID=A0ABT5MK96_9BURK|nr:hypothetical protein [Curvibacter sp. HBC28]MDD0816409.1 hypothetical protein [Curvibacter sp. HBC28]
MYQSFVKSLVASALCMSSLVALAQDAAVPKHLQLAREFVANTKQENNEYSNTQVMVRMPGEKGATDYIVHTDCTGFVESMLRRTKSGVLEQMQSKKFTTRHSIYDYHPSIEKGEAFERITKVTDLKPGDVVAWLYVNTKGHTAAGHILFVDEAPVKVKSRLPFAWNSTQYEVRIIDTSQEAKSRDDTRYVSDAGLRDENEARGKENGTIASPNFKGVGRGTIRFYADDTTGEIKGVAYNIDNAKFHAQGTDWNIVMGRPKLIVASGG